MRLRDLLVVRYKMLIRAIDHLSEMTEIYKRLELRRSSKRVQQLTFRIDVISSLWLAY